MPKKKSQKKTSPKKAAVKKTVKKKAESKKKAEKPGPLFLSVTAFARLAGVTRQAIYDQIETGRVIRTSSGKIDPTDQVNKDYLTRREPKPATPSPSKKTSFKKQPKKKATRRKFLNPRGFLFSRRIRRKRTFRKILIILIRNLIFLGT